jgi:glycosyltransferase involved in cell wall biosynthesis
MQVIISTFGRLGSTTGGGKVAFEVSRYLHSRLALKRVLCMSYDESKVEELGALITEVAPEWSVQDLSWRVSTKAEQMLVGTTRYSRRLGEEFFDQASVRHLTKADILHCIKPVVPRTIGAAHRLGVVTSAEAATCHARFNKEMVDVEREKYGLPCIDPYCDPRRVERMEEAYERLDWIIAWHEPIAQTFIHYGVPKEKVRVLDVTLGFNEPVHVEWTPHEGFQVLYVAHTNLLKGLHYLLGAWERYRLHEVGRLTVCGYVDANTREIIRKEGWDLPGVRFVGFVNPYPYYEWTDVVVVPSLSEGDSFVTREAMAYGIPVILTEGCGNKEIVKRFETGVVVPVRDEEAIAEALTRLYESPELRRHLGRNGHKIAKEFTWQRYGQRLLEEFELLVEKG